MTLSDMAELACAKTRSNDTASTARAKQFLNRRNQMITNDALWRSSVFRHDFTFYTDPAGTVPFGNYYSNKGVTGGGEGGVQMLPAMVDRVLALRRADGEVRPVLAESLYRSGVDEFAETGASQKFLILPPAVLDLQRFTQAMVDLDGFDWAGSGGAADAGQEITVKYVTLKGEETSASFTLDAAGSSLEWYPTDMPQVFLSCRKAVTTGYVALTYLGGTIFQVAAAAVVAVRYPRIRLLPIPTADTAFKCLVKKKATALEEDSDEPEIPGVENCLIALAAGDLMQSQRSAFAKADQFYKEGNALLEQLKRVETVQQASSVRIVPEADVPAGFGMGDKGFYV